MCRYIIFSCVHVYIFFQTMWPQTPHRGVPCYKATVSGCRFLLICARSCFQMLILKFFTHSPTNFSTRNFFRGSYTDGRLKGPVKPCAGNIGTQITVSAYRYSEITVTSYIPRSLSACVLRLLQVHRYLDYRKCIGTQTTVSACVPRLLYVPMYPNH